MLFRRCSNLGHSAWATDAALGVTVTVNDWYSIFQTCEFSTLVTRGRVAARPTQIALIVPFQNCGANSSHTPPIVQQKGSNNPTDNFSCELNAAEWLLQPISKRSKGLGGLQHCRTLFCTSGHGYTSGNTRIQLIPFYLAITMNCWITAITDSITAMKTR